MGQAPLRPAPGVHWRDIMRAPYRPTYGTRYTWNSGTQQLVPSPETGGDIYREESGEEWWYAHCNVHDAQGQLIGIAAAGFNSVKNWAVVDETGCDSWLLDIDPLWDVFETREHRRGAKRCWLALYDLQGQQLWCRSYLGGAFYDVAQDADGRIVAVGVIYANRKATNPDDATDPVPYNPGVGAGLDISTIDCSESPGGGDPPYGQMSIKGYAVKVDLESNLIWQNAYGQAPEAYQGWAQGARIWSLAPVIISGQGPGFYVAMDAGGQTCMRIRGSDGHVVDRTILPNVQPDAGMRTYKVASKVINGTTQVLLAGTTYPNGKQGAFLAHIADADAAPYAVTQTWLTAAPPFNAVHQSTFHQLSTDAQFIVDEQKAQGFVWPVQTNYDIKSETSVGRNIATLLVYRIAPGATVPLWSSDLGEVRAYDLQSGIAQTSDFDLAVVSSTWHDEYSSTNPFGYDDLSDEIQTCLEQYEGDWPGANQYDYWNTDSYVAKLRIEDGVLLWKTEFDAEPAMDATCYPDDMKKQECMYMITEMEDGGLVISGNTSHNFDDAYLAKLHPDCQGKEDYTFFETEYGFDNDEAFTENDFVHTVHSGEVWNDNMNVHGIIRIPPAVTLTITNGALIRFADSELLDHPTRIEIMAGGRLEVNASAELTSLPGCNGQGAMWNGILVQGDPHESQEGSNHEGQGLLNMRDATVSNARTGVLTANRYPASYTMADVADVASGGIVKVNRSTFLNCRRDVVLASYENFDPNRSEYALLSNKSRFYASHFIVAAELNDNSTPKDHILTLRGSDHSHSRLRLRGRTPHLQRVPGEQRYRHRGPQHQQQLYHREPLHAALCGPAVRGTVHHPHHLR